MTLNQQLIWFLGMAGAIIAILAVGTLLAAGLIRIRPEGQDQERRAYEKPDPGSASPSPTVLVAPMGPLETAGLARTPVLTHSGSRAMVDTWGEDSFPASDPPQNW